MTTVDPRTIGGASASYAPPATAPVSGAAAGARTSEITGIALVTLEVLAIAALVWWFRLEGAPFAERVMPVAALAFLPHHLLPAKWRLPFFVAISVGAAGLLFGARNTAWIVGVVLAVIGACRLPVRYGLRVAAVLALGTVLGAMRLSYLPTPWPMFLWPILGSILMFRVVAYLYDLKHGNAPTGAAATLAYFLLLPNFAFTLFPVVDAAAFKRNYYDRPALSIYSEGVQWIARGVLQLELYRLVYQYVALAPSDVTTTATLVQYLVGNFGLYLHVSGSFHVAIGILHLFGFRLPETHRLFYLSQSFTDFWRRINIYWKEFMQKVVFAPTFYPLSRKLGPARALTIATLAVFFATWFTHAYQTAWIVGTWGFTTTDALFWGILAVVLVVNSQREMKRGRTRAVSRASANASGVGDALRLAGRTAATFSFICVLWALWAAPTVHDALALAAVVRPRVTDVLLLLSVPAAIGALAIFYDRWTPWIEGRTRGRLHLRVALGFAPLVPLALLGHPRIAGALGPVAHRVSITLRSQRFARADAEDLQRGYYEQLTDLANNNRNLWNTLLQQPADWKSPLQAGLEREVPTFLRTEMTPSWSKPFHGAVLSTNAFGMRDQAYAVAKPAGTWRIALLGQSYVVGLGVGDTATFESIVERELEKARPAGAPKVEILNFASSGYAPPQHAALLDGDKIAQFKPDVVLFVGHMSDVRGYQFVATVAADGVAIPYDTLRALVAKARITPHMGRVARNDALRPFAPAITAWSYRHIAERARALGAIPAWVSVPIPLEAHDAIPSLMALARTSGFDMVSTPEEMYIGYDEASLVVAPWDRHPNALGHRIIAERLLASLTAHPELLGRASVAAR